MDPIGVILSAIKRRVYLSELLSIRPDANGEDCAWPDALGEYDGEARDRKEENSLCIRQPSNM